MGKEAVAARFGKDPGRTLVDVIRDFNRPVRRADIVGRLVDAGVPPRAAAAKWDSQRPVLKDHPRIRIDRSQSYEWLPDPAVDPAMALARMRELGFKPAWLMEALAEVVQAGLQGPRDARAEDTAVRAARERQYRIDGVRAVAEVAMAVEEIAYKGAEAEGIVRRVRNHVLGHGLAPIGRSGEEAKFEPGSHAPLVGSPDAGSPVVIVRPGYFWRDGEEDVLIERAVVRTI